MYRFDNIPTDKGDEILQLYQEEKYLEIASRFINWDVIPDYCEGCPVTKILKELPGYMEYAIFKDLIPSKNGTKKQKPSNPGVDGDYSSRSPRGA